MLLGSAVASDSRAYFELARHGGSSIPAGAAGDPRHDADDLRQRFDALYVGLEMQSLALYVIAAFQRDEVRSIEAGLKYFVLGSLASGMLLYGASLIYGYCGRTAFVQF